jgi:hypothetical protein
MIQERISHKDLKTTRIDIHVLNRSPLGETSCRAFVMPRTPMDGSTYQTRKDSDLCDMRVSSKMPRPAPCCRPRVDGVRLPVGAAWRHDPCRHQTAGPIRAGWPSDHGRSTARRNGSSKHSWRSGPMSSPTRRRESGPSGCPGILGIDNVYRCPMALGGLTPQRRLMRLLAAE